MAAATGGRLFFLQRANAQSTSGVLTLATRTEMTATAILWRVGSSWLLSQFITSVAAKYLKHEQTNVKKSCGKNGLMLFPPRLASGEDFFFWLLLSVWKKCFGWIPRIRSAITALVILAAAWIHSVSAGRADSLVERDVLKDELAAESQQAVLLHLQGRTGQDAQNNNANICMCSEGDGNGMRIRILIRLSRWLTWNQSCWLTCGWPLKVSMAHSSWAMVALSRATGRASARS